MNSMRDVTPLIRVDPNVDGAESVDSALPLIELGYNVVVASDETAKELLVRLGLTEAEADDQIRVSYGPLAK